jgi:hypothetical protein
LKVGSILRKEWVGLYCYTDNSFFLPLFQSPDFVIIDAALAITLEGTTAKEGAAKSWGEEKSG